ncbi:MAG: AAA ATPase [Desulfonauticus sp. 38_4375]|nr:MAG: AAA ATPase [Desulfonauticus sp. 38_4375]
MISVDLKGLIENLNEVCTSTLHGAAGLCVSRTHYEISLEHFILKILEELEADWFLILKHFSVDIERLRRLVEQSLENLKVGNTGKPVFSPILIELFADSWLISSIDLKDDQIRSASLLMALLKRPNFYLLEKYGELLKKINLQNLEENFWSILENSKENPVSKTEKGKIPSAQKGSFLDRFCIDFTQRAKEGKIDPVFGRDKEIRQIIDILGRRRKNNPICVGEPGVGKTAVVEGLALRIAQQDVPDFLTDVSLLGLDLGLLEAGAGMKGEFENRLKGVIDEVKASEKPIILFIDEAHTLVGAGGSAGGSDAANLLKPALARGELRTIAATTWSEYKKYFEKDPALARRFQLVKLDEPDVSTTKLILRGIKKNYEKSHKVVVRDDAIEASANLAHKYITGRFLPDKAIDLLDTSCARVRINLTSKPAEIEDKERQKQAIEREIEALDRDAQNNITIDKIHYKNLKNKIKTIEK